MSDGAAPANHRIFYCERCGLRIPPADFQTQRATLVNESEAICAACNARTAAMAPASAQTPAKGSASAIPVAQPSHAPAAHATHSTDSKHGRRRGNSKSDAKSPLVPALAGAICVAALLGAFVALRSKPQPDVAAASTPREVEPKKETPVSPTPAPTRAVNPAPQPAPVFQPQSSPTPAPAPKTEPRALPRPAPVDDGYDPRTAVATSMLAQAKEYQKKSPEDVFGYRDKLQLLIDRYRGTPAGEEAAKLIAEIKLPAFDPDVHPEPTPDAEWAKAVQVLGSPQRTDKGMWCKRPIPYTLPEEYDLRLTFSRADGDDCLLIVLARRGKPFIFSIGSGNMHVSFEDIREKRADLIPTKAQRSGIISHNTRSQIVVQVRKNCLRGYLNGKLLVGCQVDDDGISLKPELQMPQPNQLGFMSWNTVFEFQNVEVLPLKGAGSFIK